MAKSLDMLLAEADSLIMSKTAGVKAPQPVSSDDDIFKLAEAVRRGGESKPEKTASESTITDEEAFTLTEKIAHAVAIVDVYKNLSKIMKIAAFETKALANGYTDKQVSAFIEKNAAAFEIQSVL